MMEDGVWLLELGIWRFCRLVQNARNEGFGLLAQCVSIKGA